MPQYFSPGVYVEEVDSGPRPIQGVSTSVTGAVGVTQRGPTDGKPVLVTTFNEYVRTFGGLMAVPSPEIVAEWDAPNDQGGYWWLFAHAVKGFFDNGGQQLYVKRVIAKPKANGAGAKGSAKLLGQGMIAEIEKDVAASSVPAPAKITVRHLISLFVSNTQISVKNGKTGAEILRSHITSIDSTVRQITLADSVPAGKEISVKRGDFVEIKTLNPGASSINVRAKALGAWGDDIQVRVRPMIGATLSLQAHPSDSTPVTTLIMAVTERTLSADYDGVAGTITLDAKVAALLNGTASPGKFSITGPPAAGGGSRTVDFEYDSIVSGSGVVTLHAVPASSSFKAGSVIRPLQGLEKWTIELTVADDGLQDLDTVQIRDTRYVVSGRIGKTFDLTPPPELGVDWAQKPTNVIKLRKASTSTAIAVRGANRLYKDALIELDNGADKTTIVVVDVAGDLITTPALTKTYVEGDTLRLIEAEVGVRYAPDGQIEAEELFGNLNLTNGDDPSSISKRVSQSSALIDIDKLAANVTSLDAFPVSELGGWQNLVKGDDAFDKLAIDDFVGEDGGSGKRTGIQALEDFDHINLVLVPGMWSSVIQLAAIAHCEALRYRFTLLDSKPRQGIEEVRAFRAPLDSKYAALYYPWLNVRDPVLGADVEVGSSAHMAGIYARVDTERGVHKAPANEVIRGITGISQDVTKREQDLLNPEGINAHRFFPGRGFRVWGARTISSDTNFRYINVRRIFNFIEQSIDDGTQFVVFEPNDETLWARVRQTIGNFLNTQWRAGMLEGKTADEAYFVACDRGSTMTQDDIENGRLICQVGIAPVFPAEFVVFRIQKFTADSKLK